jgi:tetratricopeptide (TPR) repeat protein
MLPPRLIILLCLMLTPACAARGPSPALVGELAKADTLLHEGCFRCLEAALSTYERLAVAPRGPAAAAEGALRAEVLLALRAKELGLPADSYLTRARERLAAAAPGRPTAALMQAYVDLAALVVGENSGFDPEERQERQRARNASAARRGARLALDAHLDTDIVAAYVALAFDCEDARTRKELNNGERFISRYGTIPLLRHRLALCAFAVGGVGAVREQDPRWVDTLFFEGRREMSTRPVADVQKASAFFAGARDAFPDSFAVQMALGTAQNALSEYAAALATFDGVLAKTPTHRDALLGRLTSLSYMNMHPDAIAAATRMIELGTWHIGDAYYWRAWNRYHTYALDAAWTDVEAATKLLINSSVYTLAGFIAYARREHDTAIDRFDRAYAMDRSNCEAVWTAGLVHVDDQGWQPAAPKFSQAMVCYTAAAVQAREEIAQTEASASSETLKARRIAVAQKRVDTAEHRKAQAAFNAAQCYVRLSQKALALNHVDVAAEHPLLREKAVALRSSIEKLPDGR